MTKNNNVLTRFYCSTLFYNLVMCNCATPGKGIGYHNNKMICTDGFIHYCYENEECYANEPFEYGKLFDGCRMSGNYFRL